MITDADIKKMKKVFATKEDMKSFATKEDLKSFATKDDLKSFATKDDLKTLRSEFISKFVTKDDLRESTDQLVELIMGGFDRIEKIFTRTNDQDEIIENHERRLDKIEEKVFA